MMIHYSYRRASRTRRERTSLPIEEEESNYMYQLLPQLPIFKSVTYRKDDGLEFNGLVHYDIPSVTDTPNGGVPFILVFLI